MRPITSQSIAIKRRRQFAIVLSGLASHSARSLFTSVSVTEAVETRPRLSHRLIIIARRHDETGKVRMIFKGEFTRFENYTREEYGEGVYDS